MSRIVVDVDDRALAKAMKEYQTETKVDAGHGALGEVPDRRARRLRKAVEIRDEMTPDVADTDWDEAWRSR